MYYIYIKMGCRRQVKIILHMLGLHLVLIYFKVIDEYITYFSP